MVPFGGWEMPLSYPSGTLAEHRACRTTAVVFDVSHLGTLQVVGADAFIRLQKTLTNDLSKIGPGQTQYTHLLEDDGSVMDDIIVWWVAEQSFEVIPNASNTKRVSAVVGGIDVTATRALLAVQGPQARQQLASVCPGAAAVKRNCVTTVRWEEVELMVAGTGYTGEDGVEIAVPQEAASRLWDALLASGIVPAGLGARDTLRLEAGFPLHGHELGPAITPLQAGLGWVVSWNKPTFKGREALFAEKDRGVARRLRGLIVEGRRPPRQGQQVMRHKQVIGEVTSGNFSPTLETGIALAFMSPNVQVGDAVALNMRGTEVPAQVAKLPFV
ncbi:MAG: glycine cleavage system aminomethyltransferase GcvT [Acidimicrobiia bacterium]|nr:glycine cleavage system aminomethyltransferase GcvT [Acidimicrobiia bacterium]MYC58529.1 glycine cleavage system aminomethyltransferase GcvT [Acidimicrobiia bacterium]MYG94287.1 glycine cleavage system aminomethyltransferase GcvT [Acidimicrobiia bacterium]MYI30364.1 glycine cleavage system aminomethyltransferase GcvT [Acidimicrobiia bacterium]